MNSDLFTDAPEGTLPMISDTGFVNAELFIEWLKHFSSFVKPTKEDPVLLILDSHITDCSTEIVLFCRDHHMTLLSLPPRASHRLQSLDVGFFGPLKEAYAQEADRWLLNHPGSKITQTSVARIFRSAYERVANMKTAVRAFVTTGIHPVNRNTFSDEEFIPSEVTFCSGVQENQATIEDTHVSVNNGSGNEVSLTIQPAIVDQPQMLPVMICPLPKAVQTKKRKRTSKRSEVLSSSPDKNTLLALRKEPSNNKQGSKTLRYDGPSVVSTCSAAVEEEKINCPVCDEAYEEPITEDWVQIVSVNNGGMKTVQATKASDSSNARCAKAHS
jgi:RNA polymerase subunit RPABC4/transcription elongation factor Spt4